jgi:hypothetical protein
MDSAFCPPEIRPKERIVPGESTMKGMNCNGDCPEYNKSGKHSKIGNAVGSHYEGHYSQI